uniref:E3 ubiquitin-protein ligase n=1 Tax=Heliothis virescens TaxID=7102 RepID=A0A2A4JZB4_HELVI
MAEQHITPSSHSALTRESSGSSPSRVVGGRWLRQVRRTSHSRRSRRNVTSPLPRSTSRHSSSRVSDAEPYTHVEPRRSSRLIHAQPRSDYSITERWSYGTDVYETRCDTTEFKGGDAHKSSVHPKRGRTSSHDRKKRKTISNNSAEECVAYCTRSRTALKSSESACEQIPNHLKPHTLTQPPLNQNATATSTQANPPEGGLLPLDERDFAYSPYSSSTVTELLDSDYSVYSPTASRRKGKKRKRSTHRSLSSRKSSCLLSVDECRKKFKIDSHSKDETDTSSTGRSSKHELDKSELNSASQTSCTYLLRNRSSHFGPPTSTVISDHSVNPPGEAVHTPLAGRISSASESIASIPSTPPPPDRDIQEASSSKAHSSASKLLIVPRDLPYLRQTNARRSIAAATGATLGACLTRGASTSQRQRQDTQSKRQVSGSEGAGSSAAGGRRARARDMPQPQPASTRRDKRGKSSLGSCASTGGASSRSHPQPLTTGAVASTSSTPPASASASMPDNAASDAKPKGKASSSSEECAGGGSGVGGSGSGAGAEESSSEEGEVGRLQALLEARGLPPHLLGALGPRMQHLLHRTVTANSAASKAAQLLAGLQATGDEGQQLQAVIEMCQLLVMGNEDTLAGFPVRQVVPALVNLLAAEHNFDMMNHACRALTYMLEALPRSSGAVALAVPAFLDKLQAITCMDVAEQSLTALDMLSRRHSKAILQARGVSACLMYLDFFSINAQRAALSITANCCQNLTPDEFHLVRDSLQLLANRLTQQDKKSVECVCLAFSRLVDSFQHDPARLQEIATPELLTNLQQLLVVQPPLISGATFITVLRLLWVMCCACPQLALALHQRSIADTLLCLLTGSTLHQEQVELIPRLPQELYEITCLIGELMPRLPTDGIFAVDSHLDRPWSASTERTAHWQWRDDRGVWRSYSWAESRALEAGAAAGEEEVCLTTLGRSYTVDLTAMQQLNDHTGTARPVQRVAPAPAEPAAAAPAPDPRVALLRAHPGLARALLAVLHEVYWSSAGPAVRSQALKAILRCVYYADAPLLRQILKMQVISSHIAGMMASSDLRIVVGSLQLAEILMQRLPDEMGVQFRREGVLHQVAQLAERAPPAQPARHHPVKSPGGGSVRSSGGSSPPASTSATSLEHQNNLSLAFSASGSFVASTMQAGAAAGEEEVCLTTLGRSYTVDLTAMQQLNDHTGTARPVQRVAPAPAEPAAAAPAPDPRVALLRAHPGLARALLAVLHEVYWSSAGPAVRSQALKAILRCVYYADAPLLRQILKMQVISSHIAGMMASSDLRIVVGSLQLAEILMQRLPDEMGVQFRREGVLHQVAQLAERAPPAQPARHHPVKSPGGGSVRSSGGSSPPASTSATSLEHQNNLSLAFSASGSFVASTMPAAGSDGSGSEPGQASASTHAQMSSTSVHRSGSPLQLAEMLKRKRAVKRSGGSGVVSGGRSATRVGGASKTSSFLSSLNPSRWGRSPHAHKDSALLASPHASANLTVQNKEKLRDTMLHHDVSPFEVNHSGVLGALLQFLTGAETESEAGEARDGDGEGRDDALAAAEDRLRLFLHVFADMPLTIESEWSGAGAWGCAALAALVGKVNACVSHLEQFPVRVHDLPARPATSALKFFNTHQLMCDLKRHPTCTNLKQWKGGVVRIDPLALVQAIERYLAQRGYASGRSRSESGGAPHSDDDAASDDDVEDSLATPPHHPTDSDHKLEFLIGDTVLPYNMTVYQAVRQFGEQTDADTDTETPLANAGIWVQTHTIYYRAVEAGEQPRPDTTASRKGKGQPTKLSSRRKPDLLWNDFINAKRHNVLRQAEHVMHEFAHSKALLEIQYENEVGTGLGPTLEFYALVSQELQRADLDLWHGSENFKQKPTSFGGEIVKSQPPVVTDRSADAAARLASSVRDALNLDEERSPEPSDLEKETSIPSPAPDATYVTWPCGLFPQAVGRNARASHVSRVKAKFRFLGKFMAKAVMDSRMVDIPLSVSMYRWLVSEEQWLSLSDVRHVAPELWRSLCRLRSVAERARQLAADPRHSPEQRTQLISALELDGCPIEELGLDFILPGDGCTELRRGGRDLPVTAHNLHNYIDLVTHWLLYEGVTKQMEAFREGFESVFPLANLKIFYPEELEQVFCGSPSGGRDQRWEPRMLTECIRPDHGYNAESRAIRMLIDILASYNREEQRLFLQFVTGSPRLPTGGFKALNPPLTVVRKSLESSLDPDEYLPSVMTCVNYLKLPDYTSAEVMRAKLRLAASEGQHSFHLS